MRRPFHCTTVYVCSLIAANIIRRGDTAINQENKSPRERGFNRGAEGWGARAARYHSSNNSAAISFPSKT